MAHNHRGQPIADPFLNMRQQMLEQQAMLAERNAGLMGINYDPEESTYDEAYGPLDRTRRARPESGSLLPSDHSEKEMIVNERKVRGEN